MGLTVALAAVGLIALCVIVLALASIMWAAPIG